MECDNLVSIKQLLGRREELKVWARQRGEEREEGQRHEAVWRDLV